MRARRRNTVSARRKPTRTPISTIVPAAMVSDGLYVAAAGRSSSARKCTGNRCPSQPRSAAHKGCELRRSASLRDEAQKPGGRRARRRARSGRSRSRSARRFTTVTDLSNRAPACSHATDHATNLANRRFPVDEHDPAMRPQAKPAMTQQAHREKCGNGRTRARRRLVDGHRPTLPSGIASAAIWSVNLVAAIGGAAAAFANARDVSVRPAAPVKRVRNSSSGPSSRPDPITARSRRDVQRTDLLGSVRTSRYPATPECTQRSTSG